MKKICSLLISGFLCAILFFQTGAVLNATAGAANSQSNAKNVSLVGLVRLKKHIAAEKAYTDELDYNIDGKINSLDIAALKRLLLGLPVDTDNQVKEPEFDNEGYYNQVVKP